MQPVNKPRVGWVFYGSFTEDPPSDDYVNVIEKSAYDAVCAENERLSEINKQLQELPRIPSLENFERLKADLEKTKYALEQTNNGRPSEWAYSILRKERDGLKAALEYALKGLDMWRKYQSPGNIADIEERINQVLKRMGANK